MKLKDLAGMAKEVTAEATVDAILQGQVVRPLPEGIHEVTVNSTRTFSKGVEVVCTKATDHKQYKFVVWLDVVTEGDYMKQHIGNLLQQIEYKGDDLNLSALKDQEVVIMLVRNNGFLNLTTDIRKIAKVYRELQQEDPNGEF